MALTPYTTPEEVRSALSVNSTELPNSVIEQPLVMQRLTLRLYDIDPNIMTAIATVAAKNEGDRSANEAKFLMAGLLLCTYAVAMDFLPTLPTLMLQTLTDGKASQDRFDAAFGETIAGVNSMYELARSRAVAWYTVIGGGDYVVPTRAEETIFTATGVAVDPVTGA